MEKLIELLGVYLQIDMNNNYSYEFDDYDEFTDIYNKLEQTNLITKNSPQSYLNEEKCHIEFDGDKFYVYLDGDFNVDDYRLKIVNDEETEDKKEENKDKEDN